MSFKIGDVVYHIEDKQWLGVVTDLQPTVPLSMAPLVCVHWDAEEDPVRWYSPRYLRKVEQPMSQALWCDQGGHAFSSKDPGKRHFSETRTVDDGYRVSQVTADMDICGPCSESSFLGSTPALTVRQDVVPEKGQS